MFCQLKENLSAQMRPDSYHDRRQSIFDYVNEVEDTQTPSAEHVKTEVNSQTLRFIRLIESMIIWKHDEIYDNAQNPYVFNVEYHPKSREYKVLNICNGTKSANVRKYINKVDFSKIKLSRDVLSKYTLIMSDLHGHDFDDRFIQKITDADISEVRQYQKELLKSLTGGERQAISTYMSDSYIQMKTIMRRDAIPADKGSDYEKFDEILMNIGVVCHTLNSLPEYDYPTSIRYTRLSSYDLKETITTAENRGTEFMNYMISSSYVTGITQSARDVIYIFKNAKGLNCQPLGQFLNESEYLIAPTTVQYTGYKKIGSKHVFTVRSISH